jgi:hypothetical protein
MSIAFENVSHDRLTAAVETGPIHYRTIMRMVRDHGISLAIVAQGIGSFNPPRSNPHILIVGDDLHQAKGPSAFHAGSLRRYIKRCRVAVIWARNRFNAAHASLDFANAQSAFCRTHNPIDRLYLRFPPIWIGPLFKPFLNPFFFRFFCTRSANFAFPS